MHEEQATDPQVAELAERVVRAYRELNDRLGWIRDAAALDDRIRADAVHHLGWALRTYPDEWLEHGLWSLAHYVATDLAEETTEPWPLRALDHAPGQRTPEEPTVEIAGRTARIRYGSCEVPPIELPGKPEGRP